MYKYLHDPWMDMYVIETEGIPNDNPHVNLCEPRKSITKRIERKWVVETIVAVTWVTILAHLWSGLGLNIHRVPRQRAGSFQDFKKFFPHNSQRPHTHPVVRWLLPPKGTYGLEGAAMRDEGYVDSVGREAVAVGSIVAGA